MAKITFLTLIHNTNPVAGRFLICVLFVLISQLSNAQKLPGKLKGKFVDDYGIEYEISDNLWLQSPDTKYHILEWNKKERYILAHNDKNNPSAMDLYTRIDIVKLKKMKPYKWGFCYTMYNGESLEVAKNTTTADKENPKTGCNGYPFSRMKRKKMPFY